MRWIDYLIIVVAVLLIAIVMMQNSKEDINDAFSGGKSELFKNQKVRGIELVLQRATIVLAVVFFALVIVAALPVMN